MGIGGIYKSIAYSYSWNEYLFWYIEQKNIEKIEWVLENKPDIIDQPLTANYKTTPLHRAAVNGSMEVCQLLVEKYKADVNVMTENGENALMGAAKRDHT
jgi:ankyrin repeat protein